MTSISNRRFTFSAHGSRLIALSVLALAAMGGAWLAGVTVDEAFAPGGNPVWLALPFALPAPLILPAVWVAWFADFFKNPEGLRWTRWSRLSLAVSIVLTVIVAVATAPFIRAVL